MGDQTYIQLPFQGMYSTHHQEQQQRQGGGRAGDPER